MSDDPSPSFSDGGLVGEDAGFGATVHGCDRACRNGRNHRRIELRDQMNGFAVAGLVRAKIDLADAHEAAGVLAVDEPGKGPTSVRIEENLPAPDGGNRLLT